jgi:hypothetical protein
MVAPSSRIPAGHGFREGIPPLFRPLALLAASGACGRWRLWHQVGAMSDEELDELIESVFGGAVQSGLVWDGVGAGNWLLADG